MMITAGSQASEFFICLCAGFASAVFYDALWYIRKILNFNKLITFFIDIAFGVFVVFSLFYSLQFACYGNARFYHYASFICGFLLLNSILSKLIRSAVIKVAHFFVKLYKRLQSISITKKIFK